MKATGLFVITMLLAGTSVLGQGFLTFTSVPVTNAGTGTLAGPQVMAELFYGPSAAPESSLIALEAPKFLTNGYAQFGQVLVPYPPGTVAEFQIRAWDNSNGLFPEWTLAQPAWLSGLILGGKSVLVNATVPALPLQPVIVPGFTIYEVPEPSLAALGLLSIGLWQAWRAPRRYDWRA
jgi:hypothetical protein